MVKAVLKKKKRRPKGAVSQEQAALDASSLANPKGDRSYLTYSSAARQLASTKQVLGPVSSRVLGRGMDYFLYKALGVLHANTEIVSRGVCEITVLSLQHRRRLFSKNLTKAQTLDGLFSFIVQSAFNSQRSFHSKNIPECDEDEVIQSPSMVTLIHVNLDQAYLRTLLAYFRETLFVPYTQNMETVLSNSNESPVALNRMSRIEVYAGGHRVSFYGAGQRSMAYFRHYAVLIEQIGVKYYKNSLGQAALRVMQRKTASAEELFRLFMVSLVRCLDRYDYNKGTFTQWFNLYTKDASVKGTFLYDSSQLFNINTSSLTAKAKSATNPEGKLAYHESTYSIPFDPEKIEEIEDDTEASSPLALVLSGSDSKFIFSVLKDSPGFSLTKLYLGVPKT